jgi:hypothetical protein
MIRMLGVKRHTPPFHECLQAPGTQQIDGIIERGLGAHETGHPQAEEGLGRTFIKSPVILSATFSPNFGRSGWILQHPP